MRRPEFRIETDGKDATAELGARLMSATVTDGEGWSADSLTLKFENADGRMEIPFPETRVRFLLGYAGEPLRDFGEFYAHKVRTTLSPATVELSCKSISRSAGSEDAQKELFKTTRSREWSETDTVDSALAKIAAENGYAAKCGASLRGVAIPRECLVQHAETDGAFLRRVAAIASARLKAFDGYLMLFDPEKDVPLAAASASVADAGTGGGNEGSEPTVLDVSQITSGDFSCERTDKFKSVKAKWHSVDDAALHEVSAGSGEPSETLKDEYDCEDSALRAARAKLAEMRRNARTCSVSAQAVMSVCAEGFVRVAGTRDPLASGDWRVKSVTFTLDAGGLKMSFSGVFS